jgi:heterodisulfide reductase subunit B
VKGNGEPYGESLLAVFEALGARLDEQKDWNCCGATAYMSVDEMQALALASRNLAMADQEKADLVAPCSACYLVLLKTQRQMEKNREIRERICEALGATGLEYKGTTRVRHPLDVLINDIGVDEITSKVTHPLKGLKVAPYYGCQIVRPYALFDDQYAPTTMDKLLEATGAEVVNYPFKTRCCGGSQTGTIPEAGLHLVYMLLNEAKENGADIIATVCPLCQFNLGSYQDEVARKYGLESLPIVYVTQVLGVALGVPAKKLGLHKSIVPAEPILTGRTADVT